MERRAKIQSWPAVLVASVLAFQCALASEPRAMAGTWKRVGTNWLFCDPVTAEPTALLDDSSGWHFLTEGAGVIQGTMEKNPSALAVITVGDVLREFWAQPSVWNTFQRGPSAYSGFDKAPGPREWAGRSAFDRRAYALDPGSREKDALVPPATSGVGLIRIERIAGSLFLKWHALPGRVYIVEFTNALGLPFQPLQTVASSTEGDVLLPLPVNSANAFYRVAEQVY